MKSSSRLSQLPQHSTGAFSLVELSIVLVILGLLVGGILSGQALIRAAELRAVATEYSRYIAAMGTFRDKYFALPGDMSTATNFWGTAGTCPGNNASPSTTAATCNGDGDGLIVNAATNSNEMYRFWQHLANAGLIEGSYTGVANNANPIFASSSNGVNVPRSKLSGGGWSIDWIGNIPISSNLYFEGNYGNAFSFGGDNGVTLNWGPVLKPDEAWNIDTKLDDGMPATGRVLALEYFSGTCTDLASSITASLTASVYLFTNSTKACALILKAGY